MNSETTQFLKVCLRHGVRIVSVETCTNLIKSSIKFGRTSESAFADGKDKYGWPKIWGVCEEARVHGGAGNEGQCQLKPGHGLTPGVYTYRDKEWKLEEDA